MGAVVNHRKADGAEYANKDDTSHEAPEIFWWILLTINHSGDSEKSHQAHQPAGGAHRGRLRKQQ